MLHEIKCTFRRFFGHARRQLEGYDSSRVRSLPRRASGVVKCFQYGAASCGVSASRLPKYNCKIHKVVHHSKRKPGCTVSHSIPLAVCTVDRSTSACSGGVSASSTSFLKRSMKPPVPHRRPPTTSATYTRRELGELARRATGQYRTSKTTGHTRFVPLLF